MLRYALSLVVLFPLLAHAQEVCGNGVDDDNDGLVDLNDPDCPCSALIVTPGTVSYFPNPSFEDRVMGDNGLACPYHFSSAGYNAFDCLQSWHMATGATSDYFNMCGFAPSTFPMPPPDGDGAVGFISMEGYREYVGATISTTPLYAGHSYTLSMWAAGLTISATNFIEEAYNMGVITNTDFPLAIFGHPDALPFPLTTPDLGCVGGVNGWMELGHIEFQPANEWLHVSITFTPTVTINTVLIGAACDLPPEFAPFPGTIETSGGTVPMDYFPYTMVDDLVLTETGDQALTPVAVSGEVCTEDIVVSATPPVSATGHQWYLNGVAIPGQTSTTMDASALGLGGGIYTMSSDYDGQCLMGSASVWQSEVPAPSFELLPAEGCAPLLVDFADTTGQNSSTISWAFGDGSTGTDAAMSHTYTVPGTYDITLTIASDEGCVRDTVLPDAITVLGAVNAALTATPNPTDVEHTTVTLSSAGSSGDIVTWWWDLGDEVVPATSEDPDLTATFPASPGNYPVMLVVRGASVCTDTVRSVIEITEKGEVNMPNVFSPNGDGRNDAFIPLSYTGAPGRMDIFNRWGQEIFTTTALARGWDGRASGGPVPEGTYFYIVTPLEGPTRSGHVTLTR